MEKQEEKNQNSVQSPEHFRLNGGMAEDGISLAVLCEPLSTMLDLH